MKRAIFLMLAVLCASQAQTQAQEHLSRFRESLSKVREVITQLPRDVSPSPLQPLENAGLADAVFDAATGSPLSATWRLTPFDMRANPQEDLIIGFNDPNEELTIRDNFFLDGNIIIVNNGKLNLLDANFVLRGNIIVADNAQLIIRGGKLTVLAVYLYQYFIWGFAHSVITFDSTEVSVNGQSWSAAFGENSRIVVHDTHFNEVVTAGLFGNPTVEIVRSNPFEWILFDRATVNVSQAGPHIFWFVFPDSSQATLSFPDGEFVTNFAVAADDPDISGIGYTFEIDSTADVLWGLILQGGCDVTVKDSHLRTTGIQAIEGDSLVVSGLVNDQYYADFTAPISDRHFHLLNSTLDTWNVYPWGIGGLSLNNSIIGEMGTAGGTETFVEASIIDGSGGYVFTGDSSFTVFFLSSVFSHNIAGGRSVQVHVFSSLLVGDIIATEASIMLFINTLTQRSPVARDTSAIVEMAVNQPEGATVEQLLPVTGTAVVSGGPFFPIDLKSYRLEYGAGDEPQDWNRIGSVHHDEVRNDVLETWDTHGLAPGLYTLKLTLFVTEQDSLEALRGVYLGDSNVTSVSDDKNKRVDTFSLFQNYPNPFNPQTTIQYQLAKDGMVTLGIYNLLGQKVRTLVNTNQTAGRYSIIWDGRNDTGELVTSGKYFYKLKIGETFTTTRKMLLLR